MDFAGGGEQSSGFTRPRSKAVSQPPGGRSSFSLGGYDAPAPRQRASQPPRGLSSISFSGYEPAATRVAAGQPPGGRSSLVFGSSADQSSSSGSSSGGGRGSGRTNNLSNFHHQAGADGRGPFTGSSTSFGADMRQPLAQPPPNEISSGQFDGTANVASGSVATRAQPPGGMSSFSLGKGGSSAGNWRNGSMSRCHSSTAVSQPPGGRSSIQLGGGSESILAARAMQPPGGRTSICFGGSEPQASFGGRHSSTVVSRPPGGHSSVHFGCDTPAVSAATSRPLHMPQSATFQAIPAPCGLQAGKRSRAYGSEASSPRHEDSSVHCATGAKVVYAGQHFGASSLGGKEPPRIFGELPGPGPFRSANNSAAPGFPPSNNYVADTVQRNMGHNNGPATYGFTGVYQ